MAAFKEFLKNQKDELPRLPVPSLHQTMQIYLKSVVPLITAEELKVTEKLVSDFSAAGGIGEKLQRLLEERAKNKDNWLADWWLNVAYLDFRSPLPVYSNTGLVFPLEQFHSSREQCAFAAAAVAGALDFMDKLYSNQIPVEHMGPVPLDMSQFLNVYSVCRIPGQTRDTLSLPDVAALPKHIVVIHNNHFFAVPVFDVEGKVLNQNQIVSQLENVIAQSPQPSDTPVGILTTENRTTWSNARDELIQDETNRQSLQMIERGLFVICLDGPAPSEAEKSAGGRVNAAAQRMMHGGGIYRNSANRWFDSVSQFIFSSDGDVGLSYEHSPGDSHPIITDHMQTYWLTKNGSSDPVPPAGKFDSPQQLKFNVSKNVQAAIEIASQNLDRLIEELEINCYIFSGYGKDFIKLVQFGSPDSYIQMAIQLAFYRMYNEPGAQYESAMTRRFLYGRTDTIRSCSRESVNFAHTMLNPGASDADKASALKVAMKAHKDYIMTAISGQAVDRHLLGLRLLAAENNIDLPALFSDPGFIKSGHMRLSTSQVPAISSSYGLFGPLVSDGYGCCYNIRANEIVFGTTAFNSCSSTSATKFCQALEQSLDDMKVMLSRTLLQEKL